MDIKAIIQLLRDKGRVSLRDQQGQTIELIEQEKWDGGIDQANGVFLLFDLFQIRSIAMPFSDVSLDIVDYNSKPVIYHSPANRNLSGAPVTDGKVKFAMIREGNWNKLLFNYGKLLIWQMAKEDKEADFEKIDKFPLLEAGVKEMFLGPEGEVKMLKG